MSTHTLLEPTRRSFLTSAVGAAGILAGWTADDPDGDGDPGTDPGTEPEPEELDFPTRDAVKPVLVLSTDDPPSVVSDVQTLATAGVENTQQIADMVPTRRSMAGPPGMPSDRVALWREAFDSPLTDDEEFLSDADEAGRPITYLDGAGTQAAVDGYVAGWEENQDLIELIGEV